MAFLLKIVSWMAETISTGNCTASSTIKVVVMSWKFSKHHEKVVRFFVYNTFNKMKETDEDSVIFRRILKFSDDCRRFPKKSRRCFEHISYISQSPGSRVQSPESSPDFRLCPKSFVRGVVDENMVDLFCKMMTLITWKMCSVIV